MTGWYDQRDEDGKFIGHPERPLHITDRGWLVIACVFLAFLVLLLAFAGYVEHS